MISYVIPEFCMVRKMGNSEKLICGDCKGITEFPAKRGSGLVEALLWVTLFFPGIFYSMWRRMPQKKTCQYCGSDYLFPYTPESLKLINSTIKITKKNDQNL